MVLAGISFQGKTDLRAIEKWYFDRGILSVYVRPYAGAVGPDFVLVKDSALYKRHSLQN